MRLLLPLALCCFLPAITAADTPTTDPYEIIYEEQVRLAELELAKVAVQRDFDRARLTRLETIAGGAIPEASAHDARRVVALDELEHASAEARVRRARAQLAIVRTERRDGNPVSLCGALD